MRLIADVGSNWGGSYDNAAKCVLKLAPYVDCVKFQLCEAKNGNKPLPMEYLADLVKLGKSNKVKVSASVWNDEGYNCVVSSMAEYIKFAYSAYDEKKIRKACRDFKEVFVTKPIMEIWKGNIPREVTFLWTYEINAIPQYPVTAKLNHYMMYSGLYEGYSHHGLNIKEIENAAKECALVCEYHANPLYISDTPDSIFALTMSDIRTVNQLRDKNDLAYWF